MYDAKEINNAATTMVWIANESWNVAEDGFAD